MSESQLRGPRGERGGLTTAHAFGLVEDAPIGASDPFVELRAGADDDCPIYAWPHDGAEAASRTADIMSALAATSPYRGLWLRGGMREPHCQPVDCRRPSPARVGRGLRPGRALG